MVQRAELGDLLVAPWLLATELIACLIRESLIRPHDSTHLVTGEAKEDEVLFLVLVPQILKAWSDYQHRCGNGAEE